MIVPILLGLTVAAVIAKKKPQAPTDPSVIATRRIVFQTLLDSKNTTHMRNMLPIYKEAGCEAEVEMLQLRIALHERPPELVKIHRAAYKKLMASNDIDRVRTGAMAFESIGASKAAIALFERVEFLEKNSVQRDTSMPEEESKQLVEPMKNGLQYVSSSEEAEKVSAEIVEEKESESEERIAS